MTTTMPIFNRPPICKALSDAGSGEGCPGSGEGDTGSEEGCPDLEEGGKGKEEDHPVSGEGCPGSGEGDARSGEGDTGSEEGDARRCPGYPGPAFDVPVGATLAVAQNLRSPKTLSIHPTFQNHRRKLAGHSCRCL